MSTDDSKISIAPHFVNYDEFTGTAVERILVCGNGFDMAHHLKTSYADFMDFVKKMHAFIVSHNNGSEPSAADRLTKDERKEFISVLYQCGIVMPEETADKCFNEIRRSFGIHNSWLEYFQDVYDPKKRNWNDLETVVGNVLQKIVKAVDGRHLIFADCMVDVDTFSIDKFLSEIQTGKPARPEGDISLEDKLKRNYEEFRGLLHIYIGLSSDHARLKPGREPNVSCIKPDIVITFNYTDTYEKVYGRENENAEIFYPHGKLRHSLNDIVVGTEVNLTSIGRCLDELNKSHQKAKFATDTGYNTALDRIRSHGADVFFFGHSLCYNDRGILSRLLPDEKDDCKVRNAYICCISEDDKSEKIRNAKALLGDAEFERMSASGRIRFLDAATEWEKKVPKK